MAGAEEHGFREAASVERIVEGLADLLLVERGHERIDPLLEVLGARRMIDEAIVGVGAEPCGITQRGRLDQIEGAGQLHHHRLRIFQDADSDGVEIRPTALPIARVPSEENVVARSPLGELERTRPDGLRPGIRALHRDRIDDVEVLEEVEHRRPGLLGLEHDRALVGRIDRREPVALIAEPDRWALRIADAEEVPLHVVAGEFATRVPLDTWSKSERDPLQVGAEIPSLREHWLRLQLLVILDQSIEREEKVLVCRRGIDVRVQVRQVGRQPVRSVPPDFGRPPARFWGPGRWHRGDGGCRRGRDRCRSGGGGGRCRRTGGRSPAGALGRHAGDQEAQTHG